MYYYKYFPLISFSEYKVQMLTAVSLKKYGSRKTDLQVLTVIIQ